MTLDQVLHQVVQSGIALIGCMALILFNDIKKTIERMSASLEALNQKMAVICERVDTHEKRIDRLENS